jgi:hypothetical protein
MEKWYIEQNSKGFEGDSFLKEMILGMCIREKFDNIIETGTYLGATTFQLSSVCENITTIEQNKEFYDKSSSMLFEKAKNVLPLNGNVTDLLGTVLKGIEISKKIFIYEDAHWGDNNPLLKELEIIKESGHKPFLMIHDFYNPNHPDYGFDIYENGSIVYNWDYIKKGIEAIYGNDYKVTYNDKADGAKRGIILIEPTTKVNYSI